MKHSGLKIGQLAAAILLTSGVHAATTVYTDQAAFVAAAGDVVFDSFENLDAGPTPFAALDRPGYSVSSTRADDEFGLYVFDGPSGFGAFATDGDNYLVHQTDVRERLRFDFDTPVNSFGMTITDWDNPLMTPGAELLFGNDAGDKILVTAAALDGGALFFGIVNPDFAFTYVEFGNGAANDAYGFDGVMFGSPVPLPAAVWMLAGALGGLLPLRGRKEKIRLS